MKKSLSSRFLPRCDTAECSFSHMVHIHILSKQDGGHFFLGGGVGAIL